MLKNFSYAKVQNHKIVTTENTESTQRKKILKIALCVFCVLCGKNVFQYFMIIFISSNIMK